MLARIIVSWVVRKVKQITCSMLCSTSAGGCGLVMPWLCCWSGTEVHYPSAPASRMTMSLITDSCFLFVSFLVSTVICLKKFASTFTSWSWCCSTTDKVANLHHIPSMVVVGKASVQSWCSSLEPGGVGGGTWRLGVINMLLWCEGKKKKKTFLQSVLWGFKTGKMWTRGSIQKPA